MIGQGLQRLLRHRVDRERRGEGLDVEDVGSLRVFAAGAGPEQALRASAGVVKALPPRRVEQGAVGLVGALGNRDAELPTQRMRHLVHDRHIPPADEHRGNGRDIGIEPGRDAPLDAAQECFCGRDVVLAREEQCHVDRYAGESRLFDRRQTFLGARDLDEKVRDRRSRVEILRRGERARRVVRQERRYLERHPPVDPVCLTVDRAKEIGGALKIIER